MSSTSKNIASESSSQSSKASTKCPYHASILNLINFPHNDLRGKDVMDRFFSEGPDEQPAIFNRPDINKVSISKGCTCADKADRSASRL
ncbi:hypothetical protein PMZ80_004163 [Knufia obscura]|uniref:Uncharacterized protein n=2 Tax=Knufia TaxID=430999 RepID=A0AAN8I3S7_9EURO|nr:hypothetical protein PMZ80_004163 [Knufia obscura]KAK5948711.1 hypothetical protein OHC33_010314 [Knufia fluminis]